MKLDYTDLIIAARKALSNAYIPYSGYPVGAAVLTARGEVYTGCNIENASYGATVCAERVAIFSAVAGGDRDIVAIAVYNPTTMPYPCGICRQVISEFGNNIDVVVATDEHIDIQKISQLLPHAFSADELGA